MQNEQRSSQPFMIVTKAVFDAPERREEAGRLDVEDRVHRGRPAEREIVEEAGELGDVVGADDQVDPAHLLEEALALLLRDAAGDDQHQLAPIPLLLREPAHLAAELLLGLLADAARIQDDHVRLGGVGLDVAGATQHLVHALRVVHVHLAAEGRDRVGRHGR